MSIIYGKLPDPDFWETLSESRRERERKGRFKDAALICGIVFMYIILLYFFPDVQP